VAAKKKKKKKRGGGGREGGKKTEMIFDWLLFNGAAWAGITQGDNLGAGMPNRLIFLPRLTRSGNQIAKSFRYAV
jgi:hypothetical protein